jgi:hypothetical protein
MNINVLGTQYSIIFKRPQDDKFLVEESDGYCDKTTKELVIVSERETNELGDFSVYQKQCLRHEIIHAFMFESGLANNWEHPNQFGPDETTVDWFAIQGEKIYKAWREADAI